jgi:hypothetical protein
VTAAAAAAAAAQADATAALTALTNIASDNILSPGEKPAVVLDYSAITAEQAGIDAQATAYSITTEKTTYDNAVSALTTYLGTLTGWNTIPGSDVTIVGTTFRSKFSDVYTGRQALLNAIYAKAKALADAAQTGVNQINSVDYLSNQDKIQLRRDWDAEQQIKTQLDAQAASLGVTATAYDNAVAALSTNLIAAGAPAGWATSWPDGTTFAATSIVTNLRTWWSSIATNRAALQKSCQDKIQTNAAYADAMARSTYNLIKNPNSEDANPTGFEANGVTTTNPYIGTKCRQFSGGASPLPFTGKIPCAPGDQFALQLYGLCSVSSDSALIIYMSFWDASGAEVQFTGTSATLDWTSYKLRSTTQTAPATAVSVSFAVRAGTSGVTYWLDCLYATRLIATGMIQTDAIQSSDYAEDGFGNPTAGFKASIGVAQPMKCGPAGLQVGTSIFNQATGRWNRLLNGPFGNSFSADSGGSAKNFFFNWNTSDFTYAGVAAPSVGSAAMSTTAPVSSSGSRTGVIHQYMRISTLPPQSVYSPHLKFKYALVAQQNIATASVTFTLQLIYNTDAGVQTAYTVDSWTDTTTHAPGATTYVSKDYDVSATLLAKGAGTWRMVLTAATSITATGGVGGGILYTAVADFELEV